MACALSETNVVEMKESMSIFTIGFGANQGLSDDGMTTYVD